MICTRVARVSLLLCTTCCAAEAVRISRLEHHDERVRRKHRHQAHLDRGLVRRRGDYSWCVCLVQSVVVQLRDASNRNSLTRACTRTTKSNEKIFPNFFRREAYILDGLSTRAMEVYMQRWCSHFREPEPTWRASIRRVVRISRPASDGSLLRVHSSAALGEVKLTENRTSTPGPPLPSKSIPRTGAGS